ncbi:RNA polymerase III C11 subunit, partial [Spiromyces aspiralis]
MVFCPFCCNLLLIQPRATNEGEYAFVCQTCPYLCPASRVPPKINRLKPKEVDDIFGGPEAWQNADSTKAVCPKCGHDRAYYMQLQIRSADEPMTMFYRCCNAECSNS